MSQFTIESARRLLFEAGLFYYKSVEEERKDLEADAAEDPEFWTPQQLADTLEEIAGHQQVLNQNDTWGWAVAMGERVADDELIEVASLFWEYGQCGILYWVSKKNDGMRSEFFDINRKVEFVEHEERIKAEHPGSSARAYHQTEYTIKGDRKPHEPPPQQ